GVSSQMECSPRHWASNTVSASGGHVSIRPFESPSAAVSQVSCQYSRSTSSTLLRVARGRNMDASEARITSRVGLGPTGHGGFTLSVSLDLHAPHLSAAEAVELMTRAHERCPYSNATRGNIDVQLTVDGAPLAMQAAQTSSAN